MGNYRSKLDIIADILHVISGDARKTQVMYRANLSYRVMQKYLSKLTAASLIGYDDVRCCYFLTDKGRGFLIEYSKYFAVNSRMRKHLIAVREKKSSLEKMCSSS